MSYERVKKYKCLRASLPSNCNRTAIYLPAPRKHWLLQEFDVLERQKWDCVRSHLPSATTSRAPQTEKRSLQNSDIQKKSHQRRSTNKKKTSDKLDTCKERTNWTHVKRGGVESKVGKDAS